MNVGQSHLKLKGNIQTDTVKPPLAVELKKFTGQLVAAEGELHFANLIGSGQSRLDASKDLFEEKKSKKQLDQDRNHDDAVASYVTDQQTRQTQQQAQQQSRWSNGQAENDFHSRKLTNQTSGVQLRKGIDEIQGRSAQKIAEQKFLSKKGNLFNPALAQAETKTEPTAQFTKPQTAPEPLAQGTAPSHNPSLTNQPEVSSLAAQQRQGAQAFDSLRQLKLETTGKNQANVARKVEGLAGLTETQALSPKAPVSGFKSGNTEGLGFQLGDSQETVAKATQKKGVPTTPSQRYTPKVETKELGHDIKMMFNAKKTEMTLKLRPEHLGKVEVKLHKEGDILKGKLTVDSIEAKEALSRALPELRETLQNQGLQVDQFTVEVNDQSQNSFAGNGQSGSGFQEQGTQPALSNPGERRPEPRSLTTPAPIAKAPLTPTDNLNIYA